MKQVLLFRGTTRRFAKFRYEAKQTVLHVSLFFLYETKQLFCMFRNWHPDVASLIDTRHPLYNASLV
jgi:hypothetical protein